VFAAVVDVGAEYLGARAGGASAVSSAFGAVVGVALLVVVGPSGLLVGVVLGVGVVEVYRGASLREGVRAAAAALAAGLVQAALALMVLVVFLLAVL
jgi:uncharacterized protein YqgC (DUF456 family)